MRMFQSIQECELCLFVVFGLSKSQSDFLIIDSMVYNIEMSTNICLYEYSYYK